MTLDNGPGTALNRTLQILTSLNGQAPRSDREGQYAAHCPAHDDRTPSLSVGHKDDKVVIHCHGGCPTAQVCDALGLTERDLFDTPYPRKGQTIEAPSGDITYTYTDENGTALFQVVRLPGKRFYQQKAAIGGGFEKGMSGVRRVLYNLPSVIKARQEGETVWVVEGEKDADAMTKRGLVATTSPMGAGKWKPEYAEFLTGCHVNVIMDNDKAGEGHGKMIGASLHGKALSLKAFKPAQGKDVSDHFEAKLDIDQLIETWFDPAAVDAHQEGTLPQLATGDDEPAGRRLTVTRASDIPMERAAWLWDTAPLGAHPRDRQGRILAGALGLGAGRAGCGKSQHLIWLIACLTTGTLPGAYEGKPQNCILGAQEDSWGVTIMPRLKAAGADLTRVLRVSVVDDGDLHASLTLPTDTLLLEQLIEEEDVKFVAFDPLLSFLSEKIDDYRAKEIRAALEPLGEMADRTGCTLYGLAHLRKAGGTDPLDAIAGSSGMPQVARVVNMYSVDESSPDDGPARCVMSTVKSNVGSTNIPSLEYRAMPVAVPADDGGAELHTTRLEFSSAPAQRSVTDILRSTPLGEDDRDAVQGATEWLLAFLKREGGTCSPKHAAVEAIQEGITAAVLKQARRAARIIVKREGFGGPVVWHHPYGDGQQAGAADDPKIRIFATAGPAASVMASQTSTSTQVGGVVHGTHQAENGDALQQVCDWLTDLLEAGDGAWPGADVHVASRKRGVEKDALMRARRACGIVISVDREGSPVWRMPTAAVPEPDLSPAQAPAAPPEAPMLAVAPEAESEPAPPVSRRGRFTPAPGDAGEWAELEDRAKAWGDALAWMRKDPSLAPNLDVRAPEPAPPERGETDDPAGPAPAPLHVEDGDASPNVGGDRADSHPAGPALVEPQAAPAVATADPDPYPSPGAGRDHFTQAPPVLPAGFWDTP